MVFRFVILLLLLFPLHELNAQTGPGIGFYPTGTEPGIGFRSGKDVRWVLDARISKPLFSNNQSIFVSELSVIHRLVYLEKVRFHIGLGYRGNWNFSEAHKQGVILPLGVEAFPFPFQNAGLIFEIAPFYETTVAGNWNISLRTIAGFVFYFPKKQTNHLQP